jgi:hypothetical protein
MVPITEANQGLQVYAVTHQLVRTTLSAGGGPTHAQEVLRELREGGASLRAAEEASTGLTSLTTPTHEFVEATRELFATLQLVRGVAAGNDHALDVRAALASLPHGCALESRMRSSKSAASSDLTLRHPSQSGSLAAPN